MGKKTGIDYASLFTRRKDGVFQKCVNGKYYYSKDPYELYLKVEAAQNGTGMHLFKDVAEEWEREYRETVTVRTWANMAPHVSDIVARHGSRNICDIVGADIVQDLQAHKAKGYSRTVVNTRKVIYNAILNYAVAHNYIKFNPAVGVPLPRGLHQGKRSAPTEEEMKKVFSAMQPDDFSFFPFFLLCTGLRKSEALALTREDIDLQRRVISVTKALTYIDGANPTVKPPKTESGVREVPIIEPLLSPLAARLSVVGDILFPSNDSNRRKGGQYMSERAYDVAWAHYCENTGLHLTAHQMRHGTATLLFESGVDVYTAKAMIGHSNIQTTMKIYTELRDAQKRKSTDRFSDYMSHYIG